MPKRALVDTTLHRSHTVGDRCGELAATWAAVLRLMAVREPVATGAHGSNV